MFITLIKMEELRQLKSKFKELLRNLIKSNDELMEMITRDKPDEWIEFKQCQHMKHLYILEQFYESIARKILEEQVQIKDCQDDRKSFNNDVLLHYVNFKNNIKKELNDSILRNMDNNFDKAEGHVDPVMLDLMKQLRIKIFN